MSAVVSTMLPFAFPRFIPASANASAQSQQKQANGNDETDGGVAINGGQNGMPQSEGNWASIVAHPGQAVNGEGVHADPNLDFDLLAEYLLDDGTAGGGLGAFDFSSEPAPASQAAAASMVSLDQEDSNFVDSLVATAEKSKSPTQLNGTRPYQFTQPPQQTNQIQNIINSAIQQQRAAVSLTPAPATISAPVAPLQSASIAAAPVMAPAPVAPTPIAAAPVHTPMTLVPVAPAPSHGVPVSAPASVAMTAIAPGQQIISMFPGATPIQPQLAPMPGSIVAAPGIALAPIAAAPFAPGTGASSTIPTVFVQQQHPTSVATQDPNAKRRRTVPPVTVPTPITAAAPSVTPVLAALPGQIIQPQRLPQRGGRQKTQAQIDRRRERNRILARRTRLRKKFFFESLQKDVTDLQKENNVLKEIVRSRLDPAVSKKILADCTANDELPSVVAEHCGDQTELDRQDFNLVRSIQHSQKCFLITDPSLTDNPIVYASGDFLSLTGYAREEVLGRNCRFLQGTETNASKVAQLRKAVSMGEDCTVTMINYTADGVAFWNKLFIAALRDAQNNIVNFIGVVVKVVGPDAGDPEAGKKLPGENQDDDQIMEDPDVDVSSKLDASAKADDTNVEAGVSDGPMMNMEDTTAVPPGMNS